MTLSDQLEVADPSPPAGRGEKTINFFRRMVTETTAIDSQSGHSSTPGFGLVSTTSAAAPQDPSSTGGDRSETSPSNGMDQTTVIILSTILSISGCLVMVAVIWACIRCRRRRTRLFNRGITPIGDEEIETWKGRHNEKRVEADVAPQSAQAPKRSDSRGGHQKQESSSSLRKPPSVIVYARPSEEQLSPRSPSTPNYFAKMSLDGKRSLDKDLPFTPIQARAPNAREGLTDETIPGDDPYLPGPRRRGSRLSKAPRTPRLAHTRNKSSRSTLSLRSPGEGFFGGGYDSDREIYPSHSRVSSDVPPRLSLSNDWPAGGGLSPRPLVRAEEIGRAIG